MRNYNFLQFGITPEQVDNMHPQDSAGLLEIMRLTQAKSKQDDETTKFYADKGVKQ